MTVEKFLSFWSQHNTAIIEGLVALIILFSLFLAYRAFFSKKGSSSHTEAGHGVDTAQLEKTLQRILENQSQQPKAARGAAVSEDFGVDVEMDESPLTSKAGAADEHGAVAESPAEVAQLRLTLSEGQKKIETLQAQLAEALTAAQAAASGGGSSEGGSGISTAERDELNAKLRDLEARLAEYEIISEDIADLSRYRDENDDLRKQIEALKAGGAVSAAPAPAPTPAPETVEAVAPEAPAVAEPEPALTPDVTSELAADEAAAEMAPEAPAAEGGGADLIDDDLMKEFAAAVEGQKAALDQAALEKAAAKAGDGSSDAAKNGDETKELMDEFENFVTKKS